MIDPVIVILFPIVVGMLVLGYLVNSPAAQYILKDERSPIFIKMLSNIYKVLVETYV